jgi:two-component sensor histidine kinase
VNLLKEPVNSYTDFYDIARFRLAWKINIILSFGLFAISAYFFFHNTTSFLQYFSGFVIALTGIVYLSVTKKFITVSYFISIASLLLVLSSVFFVKNTPHFIEPLWLVIITIFTYFNLGKTVGHIILTIVSISFSIYLIFFINENGAFKKHYTTLEVVGNAIEFTLCMMIIGFFIYNFIRTTAYAEQKFRESNEELNEQNKMIQLQNEEKTVLLQEIHHRVKNNLQVITSLLRLQSSEIESMDAKVHFNDAINRVMTMSLIHQKMYQEKNLSQIDTSDYFQTLIEDLIRSSSVQIPVTIEIVSKLDKVGTKTIVPLALLVAELVSNSLKHAFTESGKITVYFSPEYNGYFTLEFEDNGIWKEKTTESSFGLQLIETLTEQLDGSYTRKSTDAGTIYAFTLANLDV